MLPIDKLTKPKQLSIETAHQGTILSIKPLKSSYPFKNQFKFRDVRKLSLTNILNVLIERNCIQESPIPNVYYVLDLSRNQVTPTHENPRTMNSKRAKDYSSQELINFLSSENYIFVDFRNASSNLTFKVKALTQKLLLQNLYMVKKIGNRV